MALDYDLLKKHKLFIGTPMYGGMCCGAYALNLAMLIGHCTKNDIDVIVHTIANESLITRARNYIADEFLRSDADYLIFIDSDIEFNKIDVLQLSEYASKHPEMEVICGPYPKKCISWEKVKKAVSMGYATPETNLLSVFVGDFAFNPVNEMSFEELNTSIKNKKPIEVNESGTGFMLIKRSVFEKFNQAYPERKYKPDHLRDQFFDGSREIGAYFDCVIDPVSKRYLSEDYMFCHFTKKIGIKTWILPWFNLNHIGSYTFEGSLQAISAINAPVSCDGTVKNRLQLLQ